jgi:hypothetical protein
VSETFSFSRIARDPFDHAVSSGLQDIPFGAWDWPIKYSTPERAFLEILGAAVKAEEILMVDVLFESAATLRPELVQELLEQCGQIKAKRLFLWLSQKHKHPWFGKIEMKRINTGSGKRQLIKGGVLDPDFLITLPPEDIFGSTEPLF